MLCDLFLEWAEGQEKLEKIAPGTLLYYRQRIKKHINPKWGKTKAQSFIEIAVEEVDKHRVERIIDVRPATINREVSVLKRVLAYGVRSRKIGHNPLVGYGKLPENNERRRVLENEEIDALREATPWETYPRTRWIIEVGLTTGLRIDGALSLRWDELDLLHGYITKTVKHHRRNGEKKIKIPICGAFRKALACYKESQEEIFPEGYIAPAPTDKTKRIATSTDWGFADALKRAGIKDCHFHDLRRTFATRFLLATKDLHALASILGHSDVFVTQRYTWVLDGYDQKNMDIFENSEYCMLISMQK